METGQQSASSYYKYRKRSFLYSRIIVIASMFVLVIALGINIMSFYSQDTKTIQSNADTVENPIKTLPHLPKGCIYQQTKNGYAVACPTTAPAKGAQIPITVVLPQLPAQCSFETTEKGDELMCSASHDPIPTVPVTLPEGCTTANKTDKAVCSDAENKQVIVPLPLLPAGCAYLQKANSYFVGCGIK